MNNGKKGGGLSFGRLALFVAMLALAGLLNRLQPEDRADDAAGHASAAAEMLEARDGGGTADSVPGVGTQPATTTVEERCRAMPGAQEKSAAPDIDRDGEYDGRDDVAAYIRAYAGKLPGNYITKREARELGWTGGSLEPFAPGKSIGGDSFGNYEGRLPVGQYRECDIDTRGKPSRGGKRLVYTRRGERIYYTGDHYQTFEKVEPEVRR